jgi:membrane-associated protease RseP (regulator of RpoE activity)
VVITVDRGTERLDLEATLTPEVDAGEVIGFLGVSPSYDRAREGPIAGLGVAAEQTGILIRESARGVWALVTGLGELVSQVVGGGDVVTDARPLSPIGIARLGAESQELGFDLTVTVVAWVNIFVGLLNVLPMYPLDGGHFAVALYEKIRGRAPDVRKLVPLAAAVVIFLLVLGVIGIYLDIVDPLNIG